MTHTDMPYLRDSDPVLPVFFVSALVNFMRQQGHDTHKLLKDTGLCMAELNNPDTRSNFRAIRAVILQCEQHWKDNHLGLHFGRSLNLFSLGMIGQAAFASPTLEHAIDTIVDYVVLRDPLLKLTSRDLGDEKIYTLEGRLDLQETERFTAQAAFSATAGFIEQLCGCGAPNINVTVRHGASADDSHAWLGSEVSYGAASNSFRLAKTDLARALDSADPISAEEARRYCEQQKNQFSLPASVTASLQLYLSRHLSSSPGEQQTARALGYSTRNLRRRLAEENTTFRTVKEAAARNKACSLLTQTRQPVESIAFEVGYSAAGNFIRAFKRWTGRTPSDYRNNPGEN